MAVETLADMVRRHRLDLDMTQTDLATETGLSLSEIKDIERGRALHPKVETVLALADALYAQPEPLLRAAGRLEHGQRFAGPDPVIAAVKRHTELNSEEKELVLAPYRYILAEHRRRRR